MTLTDFCLMAALVISTTFGLIRASGVKSYFERGIFTLGGVALTYPGLLKYLSQVAELAPLLDFWEELRIIRGGLL